LIEKSSALLMQKCLMSGRKLSLFNKPQWHRHETALQQSRQLEKGSQSHCGMQMDILW
jgi:hypothetical protein